MDMPGLSSAWLNSGSIICDNQLNYYWTFSEWYKFMQKIYESDWDESAQFTETFLF